MIPKFLQFISKMVNDHFYLVSNPFRKRFETERIPTEAITQLKLQNSGYKRVFPSGLNKNFHIYFNGDKVFKH